MSRVNDLSGMVLPKCICSTLTTRLANLATTQCRLTTVFPWRNVCGSCLEYGDDNFGRRLALIVPLRVGGLGCRHSLLSGKSPKQMQPPLTQHACSAAQTSLPTTTLLVLFSSIRFTSQIKYCTVVAGFTGGLPPPPPPRHGEHDISNDVATRGKLEVALLTSKTLVSEWRGSSAQTSSELSSHF